MKTFYTLFFSIIVCFELHSQTIIWAENFNSYADGTAIGANNNVANPAADWTLSGCVSCNPAINDWWDVRSGRIEARDVNEDYVSLISEVINITGYAAVYFEVECLETGDLEGLYLGLDDCTDANSQDYADIEYSINGGFWNLIPNYEGWCGLYASCNSHTFYGDDNASGDCRTTDADWGSSTVQVLGLSGWTIQFRLSARNSANDERIQFDNISIVAYNPLPVELTDFSAIANDQAVDLKWQTGAEVNNETFTIERSQNGINWEKIHSEPGAGNSQSLLSYHTIDERPFSGLSYYRLMQTDVDGKFSYSEIKSVEINSQELNIGIFPNPANNEITLRGIHLPNCTLQVIDQFGNICLQKVAFKGTEEKLSTVALKAGVYHLKFSNQSETKSKKLVVLH